MAAVGAAGREVSLAATFSTWAQIGLRSFGGIGTVQANAFEMLVDRRKWLTAHEWAETWGVCQLAPGINMIAVAALVGLRTAGPLGIPAAVAGLMLPTALLVTLIASVYSVLSGQAVVRAAIHGVAMASGGATVVLIYRQVRPMLDASQKEGRLVLGASIVVLAAAALLVGLGYVPAVWMLLASGVCLGWVRWLHARLNAER